MAIIHIPGADIVIDDRDVIDHRRMIYDDDIPRFVDVIVTDLRAGDILVRYKTPVM